MSTATVTSKGQVTLPKDVREGLGLKAGDKVEFHQVEGRYVLRARNRSAMEFAGILHRPGMKAATIEEMNEAIGDAVAEDDERTRARR